MATHSESLAEAPPFADRPVEKTPGHWVLAHAGKTVLRPGGLALSTRALKRVVLPGSDVIEFAPSLDVTTSAIIEVGPASCVSVKHNPSASTRMNVITSDVGRCVNTDAAETGLPDESTDVVIGEAILSMQGGKAKRAIISETVRTLRPGGRYAIHELGIRPDSIAGEPTTEIRRALARVINVDARSLTVADWRRALKEIGLIVEETHTTPIALLKPGHIITDEGVLGALRIMRSVARDKDLREHVTTIAHTFKRYDRHLCDAAVVTCKPKKSQ